MVLGGVGKLHFLITVNKSTMEDYAHTMKKLA